MTAAALAMTDDEGGRSPFVIDAKTKSFVIRHSSFVIHLFNHTKYVINTNTPRIIPKA